MEKRRYDAIDGLRTIACIGIVMMHIVANNTYDISGYIYERIIPSFTNFVFVFMIVSAFGMCCGYYDKVLNNDISLTSFYMKRFQKILPFFGILVLMDAVISRSREAVFEAFADLTLLFGFLPNAGNISVIGVGWFIGLIFVFYICFPFYCVLIENKRRAWIAFVISIVYNFVCAEYFDVGRSNILYSSCYFIAGGIIYLYREDIEKKNRFLLLGMTLTSVVLYYIIGFNTGTMLCISVMMLMYAVKCSGNIKPKAYMLDNKLTAFISGISMEIYLSHMVIFRVFEKLGMNKLFGNGWGQYIITVILVLCGAIVFSYVLKMIISHVLEKISTNKSDI